MRIFILSMIFLLSTVVTSCINRNKAIDNSIFVDINSIEIIDILSFEHNKIQLETNQYSLMSDIWSLSFLKDTMVILSGKKILTFDSNGAYINTIGCYGRAADEYTYIASVFCKDNMVYVCDNNVKKIFKYYANNIFAGVCDYGELQNKMNFQHLYPLGDDNYVALNVWNGTPGVVTPMLSLYDMNFRQIEVNDEMNRTSGFSYQSPFSSYKNNVLFYPFADNSIFYINDSLNIDKKYNIDFGKYNIPKKLIGGASDEIITFVTSNKEICASMINYVHENDQYLIFRFCFNSIEHYCYYDKINNNSRVFTLKCDGMKNLPGLYCNDGYFITVWQSIDVNSSENPTLIFFKL